MDRRNFLKKAGAATLLLSAGRVLAAAETVEDSVTPDGNVAEKKRRVPVSRTADVVVCGGGPAGIGAAVEAARSGARVWAAPGRPGCWASCSTTRTRRV